MKAWVYKSARRSDTYLYVAAPDGFEPVPGALLEGLGKLELALEVELAPGRKLARADVDAVRAALAERGWYLQVPPSEQSLAALLTPR